ncbi:hypothetical protein GQ55_1G112900 [Panicum hallii var. hallii]|uniref:Uncharacterized protein n=1 Tax=Panicum hallii var. hallii TaxID=1504633 RepID=A0A2T7F4K3_9POAL|nr:hypothetical protein GQ55_1G112900 [Panicum hallii var. hallii]
MDKYFLWPCRLDKLDSFHGDASFLFSRGIILYHKKNKGGGKQNLFFPSKNIQIILEQTHVVTHPEAPLPIQGVHL